MSTEPGDAKAEAEARTAIANATIAELAAAKAKREEEEASSPQARALREAERNKGLAQAEGSAGAAQRESIASLIPDLSKVERGKLEAGTQPLFGPTLAQVALQEASRRLVKHICPLASGEDGGGGRPVRILVTSDTSLVDSDAMCIEVMKGIEWLNQRSEALLRKLGGPPEAASEPILTHALIGLPLVSALAAAVPGVLSLFAAHRSVTSATVEPGDLAATAAVMDELEKQSPKWEAIHDDVRLLAEDGRIAGELRALNDHRQHLVAHRLAYEAGSQQAAQIDGAVKGIDDFVKSITSVPAGGARSPLTIALQREALHDGGSVQAYVLVVKSQGASLQGVTDDRPLWFKDRFSTVAALSLTYFLLEAGRPGALAAGTLLGRAVGTGTIGDDLKLRVTITGHE